MKAIAAMCKTQIGKQSMKFFPALLLLLYVNDDDTDIQ
jgi:hypothetical protein